MPIKCEIGHQPLQFRVLFSELPELAELRSSRPPRVAGQPGSARRYALVVVPSSGPPSELRRPRRGPFPQVPPGLLFGFWVTASWFQFLGPRTVTPPGVSGPMPGREMRARPHWPPGPGWSTGPPSRARARNPRMSQLRRLSCCIEHLLDDDVMI
jgi:hypothetical protein